MKITGTNNCRMLRHTVFWMKMTYNVLLLLTLLKSLWCILYSGSMVYIVLGQYGVYCTLIVCITNTDYPGNIGILLLYSKEIWACHVMFRLCRAPNSIVIFLDFLRNSVYVYENFLWMLEIWINNVLPDQLIGVWFKLCHWDGLNIIAIMKRKWRGTPGLRIT